MIVESGQVAVVTGAASGIGKGLAGELAARGLSVVLADLPSDALRASATQLADAGGSVLAQPTDVSDPEAVNALARRTLEHFGRVDLVVNNAGISDAQAPLWEADLADWHKVLGINLFGVLHGIRAFVPHLIEAGRGHVVNTASLAGLIASPTGGAYAVSKHGVVALSETLRAELEFNGHPVGVTVVCPGFVNTPILAGLPDAIAGEIPEGLDPKVAESLEALRGPLQDMLEPEELAPRVIDAVQADQLYLLPNGAALLNEVQQRAERISTAAAESRV